MCFISIQPVYNLMENITHNNEFGSIKMTIRQNFGTYFKRIIFFITLIKKAKNIKKKEKGYFYT
jgi:hypothetical protein